ncbi:MAG: LysR family transcriptional regulator [Rhodospirillales bacterium]
MEIHQIRYFLAVCETLNFTRAAERCNVSQPALTRAIKSLEDELGGELLRRERNLTHLTELGRLVHEPLVRVLAETERTKKEAQAFLKLDDAPLKLGMMCTIGPVRLTGILGHLHKAFPGIQIHLIEDTPQGLVDRLMRGEVELAVLSTPDPKPDRLDILPLYRERFVLAFPPGHRFEKKNAVSIEDMDGESYLLRVECEVKDRIREIREARGVKLNICFQSQREDWIQSMVLAGLGCAYMPEYMAMLPGLPTRPVVESEISREVSLAMVAGRQFSPPVKALVSLAARFAEPCQSRPGRTQPGGAEAPDAHGPHRR